MAIKLDERNLGGRKFIYEQLYNHKRALGNVRPSIVLSPPKAHVDQGGDHFGDNPLHTMVYEMGSTYNGYENTNNFNRISHATYYLASSSQIAQNINQKINLSRYDYKDQKQAFDLKSRDSNELQAKLMIKIVEERLYKNAQLQQLFKEAELTNTHIDVAIIRQICERVKNDLDSNE